MIYNEMASSSVNKSAIYNIELIIVTYPLSPFFQSDSGIWIGFFLGLSR